MRPMLLKAAALVLGAGLWASSSAQPVHEPGSICFTPEFWCWAEPPGPPGYGCFCQTVDGPVQGVLG